MEENSIIIKSLENKTESVKKENEQLNSIIDKHDFNKTTSHSLVKSNDKYLKLEIKDL